MATNKPASEENMETAHTEYEGVFVITVEGNEITIAGKDEVTGEVEIVVRSPAGVQVFKHCVWNGSAWVCTTYSDN